MVCCLGGMGEGNMLRREVRVILGRGKVGGEEEAMAGMRGLQLIVRGML